MVSRSHRKAAEGGSLPLALLVAIIVAGLVVVIVARTLSAQNQVLFDQVYHGTLPGAAAAVEISKAHLNLGYELEFPRDDGSVEKKHPREAEIGEKTIRYEREEEEGDRTFSWTMEKLDELKWLVDATAVDPQDGRERRVLATIEERSLVEVGAFAETLLHFRGANTADSYNSATEQWCTGRGWVASNGDVEFAGGAAGPAPRCDRPTGRTVDRVFLYDWDEDEVTVTDDAYPGGDRCDNDSKHVNCTEVVHNGETFHAPGLIEERLDVGFAEDDQTTIEFIEKALAACDDSDAWIGDDGHWVASEDGGELLDVDGNLKPAEEAKAAILGPDFDLEDGHYCARSLTFDQDVGIGEAKPDEPVVIFVEGEVILRGQAEPFVDVGCPADGCHRGPDPDNETFPKAASLIIFVQDGDVAIRNHSQFAGVMYAPRATCGGSGQGQGGGSNAQADIYGAMLCDTITNAGGWRFHFDEALFGLGVGDHVVTDWREVPANDGS